MEDIEIPDEKELEKTFLSLNRKQKEIFDYVLNTLAHQDKHDNNSCSCNENNPFRVFCSGVGGKRLIQKIYF